LGKRKKKFKEVDERIEYFKTLDKNILIGIIIGVSSERNIPYKKFVKYIIEALKSKQTK